MQGLISAVVRLLTHEEVNSDESWPKNLWKKNLILFFD